MVPLQHPWGRAPSLGPCLWQRSAAGCPKTPILGPTRPLSPKVSLKNEFSLGTHQAGRVPTWSLYNTHGVAPLRLAPFLGYTGVIPMLIHSHNTPPPQHLYPQFPLKTSFPSIPTYPAGYPHGPSTTPMGSRPVAWPLSLATKRCRMPKNTYSGSHPATFAQGLPKKTSFPWVPTRRVEYPHGPSIIPMGSHPYAWPRS